MRRLVRNKEYEAERKIKEEKECKHQRDEKQKKISEKNRRYQSR